MNQPEEKLYLLIHAEEINENGLYLVQGKNDESLTIRVDSVSPATDLDQAVDDQ